MFFLERWMAPQRCLGILGQLAVLLTLHLVDPLVDEGHMGFSGLAM